MMNTPTEAALETALAASVAASEAIIVACGGTRDGLDRAGFEAVTIRVTIGAPGLYLTTVIENVVHENSWPHIAFRRALGALLVDWSEVR